MVTAVFPEHYHDNITRALDSVTVLLARYFTGILSGEPVVDGRRVAGDDGIRDEGRRRCVHRPHHGSDERHCCLYAGPLIGGIVSVFVGIVSPIEGMGVRAYGLHHRRVAADPGRRHGRFYPPAGALFGAGEGSSAGDFPRDPSFAGSLAGILGMLLAIPSTR